MDLAGVRSWYERSLVREIVDELVRIEVVDRALALASKLFVAVIPLSIILSATVPGSEGFGENLVSRFRLTGPGAAATRALFATRGAVRGAVSMHRPGDPASTRSSASPAGCSGCTSISGG